MMVENIFWKYHIIGWGKGNKNAYGGIDSVLVIAL